MSDSARPHIWQPTRLPRPWESPGKNTGVGCHFLLQCVKVKRESEVAQSCPTLSDPMDCSPPASSIHGIFQARVLEWGAIGWENIVLLSKSHMRNAHQPFNSSLMIPTDAAKQSSLQTKETALTAHSTTVSSSAPVIAASEKRKRAEILQDSLSSRSPDH